jgi:hypothetical protein
MLHDKSGSVNRQIAGNPSWSERYEQRMHGAIGAGFFLVEIRRMMNEHVLMVVSPHIAANGWQCSPVPGKGSA